MTRLAHGMHERAACITRSVLERSAHSRDGVFRKPSR